MIQTWRILTGKDMVKVETWFDMEVDRQRVGATTNRNASQHHAIMIQHDERGRFFSNKEIQENNYLPTYM